MPKLGIFMKDIVLPNTSLCAIVRDEMTNPAGGIRRFLRSVVPHVEKAVVVDTGSVDGTRQALEEAKREFPNLAVYDMPFVGYAEARNHGMQYVETSQVLVLDADEIIAQADYPALANQIAQAPEMLFTFNIRNIYQDRTESTSGGMLQRVMPRNARFTNYWQWNSEHPSIVVPGEGKKSIQSCMRAQTDILHFRVDKIADTKKHADLYTAFPGEPLNHLPSFSYWRMFNPQRNGYKGSELDVS
jgi:glycosyltransferase involved in cell wall biosynthesis